MNDVCSFFLSCKFCLQQVHLFILLTALLPLFSYGLLDTTCSATKMNRGRHPRRLLLTVCNGSAKATPARSGGDRAFSSARLSAATEYHRRERQKNMKIAFIGIGVMGKHMCGHLMKGGHSAAVFSRTASKCADLVANGATLAPSPKAAAADADAVRARKAQAQCWWQQWR